MTNRITKDQVSKAVATLTKDNVRQIAEGLFYTFKSGEEVVVLEGIPYELAGAVGKVVGPCDTNPGFINVKFADGSVIPFQATFLLPTK